MADEDRSGLSAEELFVHGEGIAYSDFTILNTEKSTISRKDISLETSLGGGVSLKTPIIAAPMDTVTSARLCIALALEGGIGAIHYNHKHPDGTPDPEEQAREIARVKRYQHGFIDSPITVSSHVTIAEAIRRGEGFKADGSAIKNFPVTEDGSPHGKLVGLLRKQDYSPVRNTNVRVSERMLGMDKLIFAKDPITLAQAEDKMWNDHISILPITDKDGKLKYLVARSDVEKRAKFPLATRDDKDRLRVLFSVSTWPESYERLKRGFEEGADGVIIDTSQGFSHYEEEMIRYIKNNYQGKLLIGGNVSTAEGAMFLAERGTDAYRCGQGSGSICTTAGSIGISRAGSTAVYECALAASEHGVKTIADGGIKEVGDLVKALSIGADACMLGNLLAGTDESPGLKMVDPETGRTVKIYRGMGSAEANAGGKRGYSKLPEGVQGKVKSRGSVHDWVPLIRDGLLHAFEVMNCVDIGQVHGNLRADITRFERRSLGSYQEAGIHSLL